MASPWDDRPMLPAEFDCQLPEDLVFEKDVVRRGAWLEYQAFRAFQSGVGALPGFARSPLLGGLARVGRKIDARHAEAARDFLRTAYPDLADDEVERRVLQAYRHLAKVAIKSRELPGWVGDKLGDHYEVEVCDGLEELVAEDTGILVLTAHVGFWEGVGLPFLALGYPGGVAVGKPPNNRYLARYIRDQRERQGATLLPRAGAIQGVSAAVRAGGGAVLLLDQRPRHKAIVAPFFGRPAMCDRSAGVLVRRVGAPIVVVGCYLPEEGEKLRLVFQRVIRPEEFAGLGPEEIMQRVNAESEELVRRAPEQYFWLHDRFRGAPA